jgi:sulfur carrier protein
MKVTINGQMQKLPDGATVTGMLEALGVQNRRVAVELNREVIPRAQHPGTPLADGDVIEVVTLVGGG